MAYVIGTDCHIRLTHADINSGNPYGFILDPQNKTAGPPVTIQREVDSDENTTIKIYFNVLMADDLINPDGSQHAASKSDMYDMLTAYLAKIDGLSLDTVVGTYSDIGASGHCSTEYHYGGRSVMACQLNNASTYWPPVLSADLYNSVWDGTLTWATSYWR